MSELKARVIDSVPLVDFATDAIFRYGTYVIQHRAFPDFRDGLKPVQRRILWTLLLENSHNNSPFKKAARITGATMGRFHPHGDSAITGALVGMAGTFETKYSSNTCVPLVHGQGNWGEINTAAAADRYIECKLSKYSDKILLNKDYLAVTPMVANYDGLEKEPLFLPSLLPTVLLNGCSGIAVGVITGIPAFHAKGVIALVKKVLAHEQITPKDCLEHLRVNTLYGGKVTNTKSELLNFYKTGEGRLSITIDYKETKNGIDIIGGSPYFEHEKATRKLMELPDIAMAQDLSNKADPILIRVVFAKNHDPKIINKIQTILSSGMNLRLNLTLRESENKTEFLSHANGFNMPKLITEWVKWRIKLEVKMREYIASVLEKEIAHQELLLLAANSLDIINRELKKKTDDLQERLAKSLKITMAESATILAMQVKSLSAISKEKVIKTIKAKNALLKEAKYDAKNPSKKILSEIDLLLESVN